MHQAVSGQSMTIALVRVLDFMQLLSIISSIPDGRNFFSPLCSREYWRVYSIPDLEVFFVLFTPKKASLWSTTARCVLSTFALLQPRLRCRFRRRIRRFLWRLVVTVFDKERSAGGTSLNLL